MEDEEAVEGRGKGRGGGKEGRGGLKGGRKRVKEEDEEQQIRTHSNNSKRNISDLD